MRVQPVIPIGIIALAGLCAIFPAQADEGTTTGAVSATQIIIPLDDNENEWVITPHQTRAKRWDSTTIERCCRDLMQRQTAAGTFNPRTIVFDEYYTGVKQPISLDELAEVEVRPLTFVPKEDLQHLANRLVGPRRAEAEDAVRDVERLRGRAKYLLPLILPYVETHLYKESYTVWSAVKYIGPHAADAIPAVVQKIKTDEGSQDSYFDVLRAIGAPAVPELKRLLHDTEGDRPKRCAAGALLKGSDAGAGVVRAALNDPDAAVRAAAAYRLGDAKNLRDVDPLSRLLNDSNPDVRCAAAHSLGVLGTPARAAVPKLLDLLIDPNAVVQTAALEALAGIHSDAVLVIPRLRPFLRAEPSEQADTACAAALRVIKRYGPDAAALAPDVAPCLERAAWYVQETALEALQSIGGKDASVAVDRVADLAADPEYQTAMPALRALMSMGPDALPAAAKVRTVLRAETLDEQLLAIEVLGAIGPTQKDAMPALMPWVTKIYGSISQAPEPLLRIMASWDIDAAITLIQVEAKKPNDDLFDRPRRQAQDAIERLKRMQVDLRAVEGAVAGQAEAQLGQRDPWIDWRWVRVLRPGDSLQRVVGLLGRPERAEPARLIYHDVVKDRATPDSRHGLRIALAEGKVQGVSLEPAPTD